MAVFATPKTDAAQSIPYKINFQGRLADNSGTIKPDGLYNMKFRIFDAATAGTQLWTETRETTDRVQVTNGLFSVQLGDVTALSPSLFNNASAIYFEIELPTPATATCSTGGCGTFTEGAMTPRNPLGASAYAFNADTIDGIDGASLAQVGSANTFTGVNSFSNASNSFSGATLQGSTSVQTALIDSVSGALNVGTTNATAINLGKTGSNITTTVNGLFVAKPTTGNDSATAFQVQNAASNSILTVDTSGNTVILGKASSVNGALAFVNSSNGNAVTIVSGVTSTGYQLTLPTALGASGDCLKDTNGSGVLGFSTCGSSSLQTVYDVSATTNPQILLSSANGGIKIQDGATPVTGNLLQLGPNGSTTIAYLGVSASAVTLQDTAGNNALLFDSTNSHLKVYENTTSPTRFADIYYDDATSSAIFAASSGTTQIGATGASGNINLLLTGAADQILANKTNTLAAGYSVNDFKFTRNLTAGAYAATGNVMTVEDLTTFGAGSSAPNVLYVNQNNTGATGNLILAQTGGGANDKFKVNTSGTVTIAAGQSYTSAGSLTLDSASGTALNIGTGANSHNTTVGNTTGSTTVTIQSGTGDLQLTTQGTGTLGIGNNAVAQTLVVGNATGATSLTLQAGTGGLVLKPITSNTTAFTLQDSGSQKFLILDTTNDRLQVGDTSADATGVLLVLDTKNSAADPTGINGSMYYNSDTKAFRCNTNGLWKDCDTASLRSEWVLGEDWRTNTIVAGTSADLSNIGDSQWTFVSIGSGGTLAKVNTATDASDQDRWGVLRMNTPATSNTGTALRLDVQGMAGVPSNMTVEFDFAPANAAAATQTQAVYRIGLLDSADATMTGDGIYFQYNKTTTAGNWERCTANNNSITCTDTGIAATTTVNTYQRLKFVTNSAGTQVDFYIDEASAGSNTADLPAADRSYGPVINMHTLNATIRQYKMDYYQIKRNLTTLR